MKEKTNQTIVLKDGRRLGYAEYGYLNGKPILEFHGNPSSRLGSELFDEAAKILGVRIIGIDRPGIGLSDFKPNRTLLDWPDDVIELADKLMFDKFSILGGSGGVPSTLSCAYRIPERLTSVGILFGPRPLDSSGAKQGWSWSRKIQSFIERNGPFWITNYGMSIVAKIMLKNPDKAINKMFEKLPSPDKKIFEEPDLKNTYISSIREAFKQGPDGVALDKILTMKSWGFKLNNISTKVYLWHGIEDTVVPVSMGKYLANSFLNCQAEFIPGEGHFSLLPNHAKAILATLIDNNQSNII